MDKKKINSTKDNCELAIHNLNCRLLFVDELLRFTNTLFRMSFARNEALH